jgi:Fe-coproporphyrin III synthase
MACQAQRSYRVLQIHPSLRCNLACRHCYSLSGPRQVERLPQSMIETLIADATAEAYTAVSVSGGEPLLWSGLFDALAVAKQCGLVTALTTNLIPLTQRRLEGLVSSLDVIAVSLDGMPASHDHMRGKTGAFAAMAARLPMLRRAGVSFGFIFTLTDVNLDELPWVAQFAIDQGAGLLQIHPLEEVGRAAAELSGRRPGELTANTAYLAFMQLRERLGDRINIQLDFAHRDVLRNEPWRGWSETPTDDEVSGLADLLSPLVVEADGTVVPLQYGFSRLHVLGNLHDASLRMLVARWLEDGGYVHFRAHCEETLDEVLANQDALPAFNWFEQVSAEPFLKKLDLLPDRCLPSTDLKSQRRPSMLA